MSAESWSMLVFLGILDEVHRVEIKTFFCFWLDDVNVDSYRLHFLIEIEGV
jgi:hypothetical protein